MSTTPQPSHGHKGGHEPSIGTDRGKEASMMVPSLVPHQPTDTAIDRAKRSARVGWHADARPRGNGEAALSPFPTAKVGHEPSVGTESGKETSVVVHRPAPHRPPKAWVMVLRPAPHRPQEASVVVLRPVPHRLPHAWVLVLRPAPHRTLDTSVVVLRPTPHRSPDTPMMVLRRHHIER